MENSLLSIFGKIWPKTLYYSTGSLACIVHNAQLVASKVCGCFDLVIIKQKITE